MNAQMHLEQRAEPRLAGPLYNQVELLLRERILANEWQRGQPLPTEVDLAREYKVSVGTMRKALDLLAHARLIVRRQGLGTFVTDASARSEAGATGWVVDGHAAHEAFVQVLQWASEPATAAESQALGISAGARVTRLSLLSTIEDRGRVVDDYVLRSNVLAGAGNGDGPPTVQADGVIPQLERQMSRFVDSIAVVRANAQMSERLGVEDGTPLLSIQRLAYDRDGRPLFMVTRTAHLDRGCYKVGMHAS